MASAKEMPLPQLMQSFFNPSDPVEVDLDEVRTRAFY
jgi:hypothetical protein